MHARLVTLALLGATSLLCCVLNAQPREILIVRHAEKPADPNNANLTPRGYARATALTPYFSKSFDTPDFVFAAQKSSASNRPVETLTPFAAALHLTLNSNIADADFATLAQQLLTDPQYSGAMIIICWHHGNIPALAAALGVSNPPNPWPDSVFDRVWRIQFIDGQVLFDNLPQNVLFGDSQE